MDSLLQVLTEADKTFILMALESPDNLTCMPLGCGRRENPQLAGGFELMTFLLCRNGANYSIAASHLHARFNVLQLVDRYQLQR